MHDTTHPAPRRLARAAGLLIAVGALAVPSATAAAAAVPAVPVAPTSPLLPAAVAPSGPCPDEDGVTVVVDASDIGGEVVVGCAPGDPESGTAALLAAGFTEARDPSGFICAIDAQPDPCPTEFTGVFWSYWSAEPGGEWESYSVGSDDSDPAPGSVEGWRYHDGSEGPTVEPPLPGTAGDGGANAGSGDAPAATDDGQAASATTDDGGFPTPLLVALGAAVLVAVVAGVAARRRRDPNGPAGQH